jgi:hypothetical protein
MQDMVVITKGCPCFADFSLPFNVNIGIAVDHNLRYTGILQQRGYRPIAKYFISNIFDNLFPVILRKKLSTFFQQPRKGITNLFIKLFFLKGVQFIQFQLLIKAVNYPPQGLGSNLL